MLEALGHPVLAEQVNDESGPVALVKLKEEDDLAKVPRPLVLKGSRR